ncbi:MAG: hypothetical protein ABIS36_04705 [Chryseolinea sp.]
MLGLTINYSNYTDVLTLDAHVWNQTTDSPYDQRYFQTRPGSIIEPGDQYAIFKVFKLYHNFRA